MVRSLIKATFLAIRFTTPWVVGAFFFTVSLVATSVISLWVGVPNAVERVADEWLDRAFAAGFPTQLDKYLYHIIRVVAFLTIVAGWIVLSFTTVFIVKWIF